MYKNMKFTISLADIYDSLVYLRLIIYVLHILKYW